MARLRFPGRPGYRFDRIGVRYGADEAKKTTDPTLSIIASIHRGLMRFKEICGDSDEEDEEFHGFTASEVKAAEKNLKIVLEKEKRLLDQQALEQEERFQRAQETLASLEAAGLTVRGKPSVASVTRRTYQRVLDTGLVREANFTVTTSDLLKPELRSKQSTALSHIKIKRLNYAVDSHNVFKRPVGRPKKIQPTEGPSGDLKIDLTQNGQLPQQNGQNTYPSKSGFKYNSAAKQILARAAKQAAHSSGKLLQATNKTRKFVLPSKSSRSSRVIKPNKRFLEEEDSIQPLLCKQAKLTQESGDGPLPTTQSVFSLDSLDQGGSAGFSAYQGQGLQLSPFHIHREKSFPAFSAAPQPSGTWSFTDGVASSKPMGKLDQPLIVEGKRPRKPSLIMRMKLVEDNPEDEIKLQQSMADVKSPVKALSSFPDSKTEVPLQQSPSLGTPKPYSSTKSLIAPAKLFTNQTDSDKVKLSKHKKGPRLQQTSQSTVVLRQAKLHLNRTALNRSKAALARSLKAKLKREAKQERKDRIAHNKMTRQSAAAGSPGSSDPSPNSLSQLSPFPNLGSSSAIEGQKLFEGMEAGAGSFSPSSLEVRSPSKDKAKVSSGKMVADAVFYQWSQIKEKDIKRRYEENSAVNCLICGSKCTIKKNRKLPHIPLCKRCKKFLFFQLAISRTGSQDHKQRCHRGGKCDLHFHPLVRLDCTVCKLRKWVAILALSRQLRNDCSMDNANFIRLKEMVWGKQELPQAGLAKPPLKKTLYLIEESGRSGPGRKKHKSGGSESSAGKHKGRYKSGDSWISKAVINARNLDKPLSVDVGQEADPLSAFSPPQSASMSRSSPRSPRKSAVGINGNGKESPLTDEEDDDDDDTVARGESRGPRIKHVCRRAAMVFPQQRATFPEDIESRKTLTLSALPNAEKQQLWARAKKEVRKESSEDESSGDSDNEKVKPSGLSEKEFKKTAMSDNADQETEEAKKGEKKQKGTKKSVTVEKAKSLTSDAVIKKGSPEKKIKKPAGWTTKWAKTYKRKIRCQECKGCKTPECGNCVNCKDKPKFGGPGKLRKCCLYSVCEFPKISRKATNAFIDPKSPPKDNRRDDDDNMGGDQQGRGPGSNHNKQNDASSGHNGTSAEGNHISGGGDGALQDGEVTDSGDDQSEVETGLPDPQIMSGLDMDGTNFQLTVARGSRRGIGQLTKQHQYSPAVEATIQLALTEVNNPFQGRGVEPFIGKLAGIKKKGKNAMGKLLGSELMPVFTETAYISDVPLAKHLIRADYKFSYEVSAAWQQGFPLIVSRPSCVRTLCYLCGSAGKDQLIFCLVCCQPYHVFCLEEEEKPEELGSDSEQDEEHHHGDAGTISWCCRLCQFCHVCGQQNGLLKCDRCHDTYHPECLGPNYPTKPSKKNIWVCTKCVRCKSCGATTPGVGTNATWTYDFSLCYECGKLMDKGNFCPVCHKCYSDDDWDSKMVQCALCESWVHAKCEEMTDEMYQLVSMLPEDVQFTCRVCSVEKPAHWEKMLRVEFANNLLNVINSLLSSKAAQCLMEPPRKTRPQKPLVCGVDQEHEVQPSALQQCTPLDTGQGDRMDTGQESNTETTKSNQSESLSESGLVTADGLSDKSNTDSASNWSQHSTDSAVITSNIPTNSFTELPSSSSTETCSSGDYMDSDFLSNDEEDNTRKQVLNNVGKKSTSCVKETSESTAFVSAVLNNAAASSSVASDTEPIDTYVEAKSHHLTGQSGVHSASNSMSLVLPATHQSDCSGSSQSPNCSKNSESKSVIANTYDDKNGMTKKLLAKHLQATLNSVLPVADSVIGQFNGKVKLLPLNGLASNNSELKSVTDDQPTNTPIEQGGLDALSAVACSQERVLTWAAVSPSGATVVSEGEQQIAEARGEKTPTKKDMVVERSTFRRALEALKDENGRHPHNFDDVKLRIQSGTYATVETFSEDMVRIIQATLFENEHLSSRKKWANSVRSIFIKQMERFFPWFNVNTCKLWEHNSGFPQGMLKDAVLPPSSDHTYAQWLERLTSPMSPQPSPFKNVSRPEALMDGQESSSSQRPLQAVCSSDQLKVADTRICLLCGNIGDDEPTCSGRLLYCGQDDWVHINCALWSAEVFEAPDGSLQNVFETVNRGKKLRCNLCHQTGATVGCCERDCPANYHFMCARADNCVFQEDKTVFCKLHSYCVQKEVIDKDHFAINRRVCVDLDKVRSRTAWGKAMDPATISVLIGSCTVETLGVLISSLSDTEECLLPVNYSCSRIYWSTQDARRRCVYTCRIVQVHPHMKKGELHIKDMRVVHDQAHPDFSPLHKLGLNSSGVPNLVELHRSLTVNLHVNNQSESHHFNDPHGLSKSWPLVTKKAPRPIDVSGLSPSTLALLDIKDPTCYIPQKCLKPAVRQTDEDLGLLRIAERLNKAAKGASPAAKKDVANITSPAAKKDTYSGSFGYNPMGGGPRHDFHRSKSLSSSPIPFEPVRRQRSSSEERHYQPNLLSGRMIRAVSPIPYVPQHHHPLPRPPVFSQSPYTIIKCLDRSTFRSASMSPPTVKSCGARRTYSLLHNQANTSSSATKGQPPLSSHTPGGFQCNQGTDSTPYVVSSDEDDEETCDGNAQKNSVYDSNLLVSDPPLPGCDWTLTENSSGASTEELSAESIQSILESVPSEMLESGDVKVVVLTDTENLSEEEIIQLATSAVSQETENNGDQQGETGSSDETDRHSGQDNEPTQSSSEEKAQDTGSNSEPSRGLNSQTDTTSQQGGSLDQTEAEQPNNENISQNDNANNENPDAPSNQNAATASSEITDLTNENAVSDPEKLKEGNSSNPPGGSSGNSHDDNGSDDLPCSGSGGGDDSRRPSKQPHKQPSSLEDTGDKEVGEEEEKDHETSESEERETKKVSAGKKKDQERERKKPEVHVMDDDDVDETDGKTSDVEIIEETEGHKTNEELNEGKDEEDAWVVYDAESGEPISLSPRLPSAIILSDDDSISQPATNGDKSPTTASKTMVAKQQDVSYQQVLSVKVSTHLQTNQTARDVSVADAHKQGVPHGTEVGAMKPLGPGRTKTTVKVFVNAHDTTDEESDYLMLDDFSYSETNDEFTDTELEGRAKRKTSPSEVTGKVKVIEKAMSLDVDEGGSEKEKANALEKLKKSEDSDSPKVSDSICKDEKKIVVPETEGSLENDPEMTQGVGIAVSGKLKSKSTATVSEGLTHEPESGQECSSELTRDMGSDYNEDQPETTTSVLDTMASEVEGSKGGQSSDGRTHKEIMSYSEKEGIIDKELESVESWQVVADEVGKSGKNSEQTLLLSDFEKTGKQLSTEMEEVSSKQSDLNVIQHVPESSDKEKIEDEVTGNYHENLDMSVKVKNCQGLDTESQALSFGGNGQEKIKELEISDEDVLAQLEQEQEEGKDESDAEVRESEDEKDEDIEMQVDDKQKDQEKIERDENEDGGEVILSRPSTEKLATTISKIVSCGREGKAPDDSSDIISEVEQGEVPSVIAIEGPMGKKPENFEKPLGNLRVSPHIIDEKGDCGNLETFLGQAEQGNKEKEIVENVKETEEEKDLEKPGDEEQKPSVTILNEKGDASTLEMFDEKCSESDDKDGIVEEKCSEIGGKLADKDEKEDIEILASSPKKGVDERGDCFQFDTKEMKKEKIEKMEVEKDIDEDDKGSDKTSSESTASGRKGPFKCALCKREYRTKESLDLHTDQCTFDLSSSEEEVSVKQLRSSKRFKYLHSERKQQVGVEKLHSDRSSISSSPLNEPLSIIISEDMKEDKFSPASSKDFSDDSSARSQDSKRSLRRSTITQRNVAPAHLAKVRHRDKSLGSPDSFSSSSRLSPQASRSTEEKTSPKETMLEAVGLVSRRRSFHLSPNSDLDGDGVTTRNGTMTLQPRISPVTMAVVPKREKPSPSTTGPNNSNRPSIMAGGIAKSKSNVKSVCIVSPKAVEEVQLRAKPKKPRQKRVWWVEQSESEGEEEEEEDDEKSQEESDEEGGGVARRTRHSAKLRTSTDSKIDKKSKPGEKGKTYDNNQSMEPDKLDKDSESTPGSSMADNEKMEKEKQSRKADDTKDEVDCAEASSLSKQDPELCNEDPLMSPRRSRRPSNRTSKLNQNLEDQKEEDKSPTSAGATVFSKSHSEGDKAVEGSSPLGGQDVPVKRGRGRPRKYPLDQKEVKDEEPLPEASQERGNSSPVSPQSLRRGRSRRQSSLQGREKDEDKEDEEDNKTEGSRQQEETEERKTSEDHTGVPRTQRRTRSSSGRMGSSESPCKGTMEAEKNEVSSKDLEKEKKGFVWEDDNEEEEKPDEEEKEDNSTCTTSFGPEPASSNSDTTDPVTAIQKMVKSDTSQLPQHVTDVLKTSNQKLRIIIRSPNVRAAQKLGEILKKTAMSVNPNATDVSVETTGNNGNVPVLTGKDEKTKDNEGMNQTSTSEVTSQQSKASEEKDQSKAEVEDGSKSGPSTPLESRSDSPDSLSAAYDIQSDDFSSDTSNDSDFFRARDKEKDSSSFRPDARAEETPRAVSTEESTKSVSSQSAVMAANDLSSRNSENSSSNVRTLFFKAPVDSPIGTQTQPEPAVGAFDEDDDDVVIVKAVGLQPPDSYMRATSTNGQNKVPIPNLTSNRAEFTRPRILSSAGPVSTAQSSLPPVSICPPLSLSSALSLPSPQASPVLSLSQMSPVKVQQPQLIVTNPSANLLMPGIRPELSQSSLLLQSTTLTSMPLMVHGQAQVPRDVSGQAAMMLTSQGAHRLLTSGQPGLSLLSLGASPQPLLAPLQTGLSPLQSGVGTLQSGLSPLAPIQTGLSSLQPGVSPLQPGVPSLHSTGLSPLQSGVSPVQTALSSQPTVLQSMLPPGSIHSNQPVFISPYISPTGSILMSPQLPPASHTDHRSTPHTTDARLTNPVTNARVSTPTLTNPSRQSGSVVIDPHAHRMVSELTQPYRGIQSNSPAIRPVKSTSLSASQTSSTNQSPSSMYMLANHSSPSIHKPTNNSTSPLIGLTGQPVTPSGQPSNQSSPSRPSSNQVAASNTSPEKPQVNYMGSFDLKSPDIEKLISRQGFTQDASKTILDLVQTALHNRDNPNKIPGVEVKTAITNTPQGPKKVLRVFINEDILPCKVNQPVHPSSGMSTPATTMTPQHTSTTGPVNPSPSLPTTATVPPSSFFPTTSNRPATCSLSTTVKDVWNSTGYVTVPIQQRLASTQRKGAKPQFRRALKAKTHSSPLIKRASIELPQQGSGLKRASFGQIVKQGGTFRGTIPQVVARLLHPQPPTMMSTPSTTSTIQNSQGQNSPAIQHASLTQLKALTTSAPSTTGHQMADTEQLTQSLTLPSEADSQELMSPDPTFIPVGTMTILSPNKTEQTPTPALQPLNSPHERASFPLKASPPKKPVEDKDRPTAFIGKKRKSNVPTEKLMSKLDKPKKIRKVPTSRRLKTGSTAHPILHHKKDTSLLPQPCLEEEVVSTVPQKDGQPMSGPKTACTENTSCLRFEISSDDGFSCQGDTMEDAWKQVLDKVQDVRAASRMKQLSYAGISGRGMFGVDHSAVVYLIEQLYGAVHCHKNYKFKYHRYDLDQAEQEVCINPSGAARSEVFHNRKPFDMFNFLKSVYRIRPDDAQDKEEEMALKSSRRATSLSLPMAMRFRKLKTFAKEAVDVYRSKIHGRGLFCKRNIDAGEMVIEYAGEVIRASLTDKREKYYESKGIGCYMFRIDDDEVVDATMHGSAARFINHSCEPNCFSKVILVDGKKHIVIFAMRPIKRGEELTYDYKFPIEEVKIPCHCGSKRCRKYLN